MKQPLAKRARAHAANLSLSSLLVLIYALPLYVAISLSLKDITDQSSLLSLPTAPTWDNYIKVFADGTIGRAIFNTAVITALTVLLQVVIAGMAAYPLARRKTRFNRWIQSGFLSVLMIPPLSILVGVYSTMVALHAISTYWGIIIILVAFGLPFPIYIFANFIVSIPISLDEAAELDGCGPIRTFFLIIAPQLRPVIVSVVILNGVGTWNEYGYALYLLQKREMYTVTLEISQYFSASSASNLNGAAAAAIVVILPLVVAYLALQKYFIKGALDAALKG
ncbi:MAG: carbohydrate ABC transporter permease [Bifidobacteriaceae bacterium]|nr:carbohydrate ABC transporter permease [Bifidobacteriaceae bacterium]